MKVLVTGASGLLGANVIEWLTGQGYEVNAFLRKSSNTLGLNGLAYNIHYGNLEDSYSIFLAAKDCRAIIHCAANTKQWGSSREEHDRINLEGTKHIIDAAGKADVDKVVFVSTANTFPFSNNPPLKMDTDYVQSKLAAEKYVLEQQIVKAVIINPSFMIGPRDSKPSSGQSILHYINHNPVFTPAGGKSFIHVKDVAEAIQKVLESPVHGRRYLLANDNRTYRSFFKTIAQISGKNHLIIPIPTLASNLGGGLGSLFGKLTGKALKLNKVNAGIINNKLYYDGTAAYQELDIKPRSIEDAAGEAVEWFERNGYF
jgi:dihydroflavonol-4-reductase